MNAATRRTGDPVSDTIDALTGRGGPTDPTAAPAAWHGNWWTLALRGVAGIIFGILAILMPGVTLLALVILFGAYAFADGLLALVAAVRGMRRHAPWGAMLVQGILGVAVGIGMLIWPAIGALTLVYLVAAWAIATGALEVATGFGLRRAIKGEWLLILGGLLSVILGLLLAIAPGAGALVLALWVGAYAIAYGITMLVLGFRLRRSATHAATPAPA